MTTVAAIAHDGHVYMAADSIVNVYERPVPGGVTKIIRLTIGTNPSVEEILLGFSGSGALPGLVAADLKVEAAPRRADTDPQPWATAVARAITTIAVDNGLTSESKMDAHLILGWRGRVWSINHTLAVPHADGIAAIGSGEGLAIGAIDAHLGNGTYPRDAVRAALNIAIFRDRYSGGPVQFEHLSPADVRPVGCVVPAATLPPGTTVTIAGTVTSTTHPSSQALTLHGLPDRTHVDVLGPATTAGMLEHARRAQMLRTQQP